MLCACGRTKHAMTRVKEEKKRTEHTTYQYYVYSDSLSVNIGKILNIITTTNPTRP